MKVSRFHLSHKEIDIQQIPVKDQERTQLSPSFTRNNVPSSQSSHSLPFMVKPHRNSPNAAVLHAPTCESSALLTVKAGFEWF